MDPNFSILTRIEGADPVPDSAETVVRNPSRPEGIVLVSAPTSSESSHRRFQ